MVRDTAGLAALRDLYAAKATAELDAADEVLPAIPVKRTGDDLGRVLLVKGEPGSGDLAAGAALAGADGEAARAALTALGVPVDSLLAVVSRPAGSATPLDAAHRRLARYLEAADPALAIALDALAADDLAAAAGVPALPFGEAVECRGRVLLAVDGLEASLSDEKRKRRVWRQFRALETHEGRR